ncbi:hypothetical protein MJT46_011773 [Ovis ammon polii x Ovis aries]|nr:hypothetical protein MJT46_011773 [Ovis ammon polii x Ovis aries]
MVSTGSGGDGRCEGRQRSWTATRSDGDAVSMMTGEALSVEMPLVQRLWFLPKFSPSTSTGVYTGVSFFTYRMHCETLTFALMGLGFLYQHCYFDERVIELISVDCYRHVNHGVTENIKDRVEGICRVRNGDFRLLLEVPARESFDECDGHTANSSAAQHEVRQEFDVLKVDVFSEKGRIHREGTWNVGIKHCKLAGQASTRMVRMNWCLTHVFSSVQRRCVILRMDTPIAQTL